jgi:hypothetical protein
MMKMVELVGQNGVGAVADDTHDESIERTPGPRAVSVTRDGCFWGHDMRFPATIHFACMHDTGNK